METGLIVGIAACAACGIFALLNVQAWRVSRRVLGDLRAEVHTLAANAHGLDQRLGRLAAAVDQSRQQLQRALELASSIHLQLYGRLTARGAAEPGFSENDASTINTYLIELKAIAVVNGDTDLIELVGRLRDAVEAALAAQADADRPTLKRSVSEATERVQRRVYALLAAATRA